MGNHLTNNTDLNLSISKEILTKYNLKPTGNNVPIVTVNVHGKETTYQETSQARRCFIYPNEDKKLATIISIAQKLQKKNLYNTNVETPDGQYPDWYLTLNHYGLIPYLGFGCTCVTSIDIVIEFEGFTIQTTYA